MKIAIHHACVDPDQQPFDVAERKGVGHPDSLADLVADTFSQRYSAWCLREFGAIPNHWVDKVNLVGAAADVRFGGFDIVKPADCYLFGKITDQVGSTEVPVEEIFRSTVIDVLPAALGDRGILEHLRLHINNTRGTAVDHDPRFYQPEAAADITAVLAIESVANDTVICVGTSNADWPPTSRFGWNAGSPANGSARSCQPSALMSRSWWSGSARCWTSPPQYRSTPS